MAEEISKEDQEKIKQLQMFEQSLQNLLIQKQQIQIQLIEIESALKEIETTSNAYKIVGNIIVESEKDNLKKELLEKKELYEMRIKSLEKQEKQIKEKTERLQKEVLDKMK